MQIQITLEDVKNGCRITIDKFDKNKQVVRATYIEEGYNLAEQLKLKPTEFNLSIKGCAVFK